VSRFSMIYRSERQVFCLTRFPSAKHKGKFSFQCLVSGTVYGRNYKIGNNRVSVAECILVYMWLLVVWWLDDSFRGLVDFGRVHISHVSTFN
jgi:hypothetical protein